MVINFCSLSFTIFQHPLFHLWKRTHVFFFHPHLNILQRLPRFCTCSVGQTPPSPSSAESQKSPKWLQQNTSLTNHRMPSWINISLINNRDRMFEYNNNIQLFKQRTLFAHFKLKLNLQINLLVEIKSNKFTTQMIVKRK